ncbi:DUF1109 domain-containing protein [Mesorhizobium loti]|nr:NrsF family protein [Mesorhizobium loti]PLP59827.1 DUF1109 domain-containing protein [Mesorhizobium loti]
MKTDELIKTLGADAKATAMPLGKMWLMVLTFAAIAAAVVFFMTIGMRPDFMQAMQTIRFLFKFVFTGTLAITAFVVLRMLAMPGAPAGKYGRWLFVAPLLMAVAVVLELFAMPSGDWGKRLMGNNMMICLAFIPLIGLVPLAALLVALKQAAPTRPVLSGAVAGLLAGGLAATFYAAHCTDDSPLFVATWYSLAIAALGGVGALMGRFFLRW